MVNSPSVWKSFYEKISPIWEKKVVYREYNPEEEYDYNYEENVNQSLQLYNKEQIKKIDEYIEEAYIKEKNYKG